MKLRIIIITSEALGHFPVPDTTKGLITKSACCTAPIVQHGTSDQFSPKCNKSPRCETYVLFSVPNTTKVLTSRKRADIPRNTHPKYDRVKMTSLALNATKVLTSKAACYFQLQIQQKSSPRIRLRFYPLIQQTSSQRKNIYSLLSCLSIYAFYTLIQTQKGSKERLFFVFLSCHSVFVLL